MNYTMNPVNTHLWISTWASPSPADLFPSFPPLLLLDVQAPATLHGQLHTYPMLQLSFGLNIAPFIETTVSLLLISLEVSLRLLLWKLPVSHPPMILGQQNDPVPQFLHP